MNHPFFHPTNATTINALLVPSSSFFFSEHLIASYLLSWFKTAKKNSLYVFVLITLLHSRFSLGKKQQLHCNSNQSLVRSYIETIVKNNSIFKKWTFFFSFPTLSAIAINFFFSHLSFPIVTAARWICLVPEFLVALNRSFSVLSLPFRSFISHFLFCFPSFFFINLSVSLFLFSFPRSLRFDFEWKKNFFSFWDLVFFPLQIRINSWCVRAERATWTLI